MTALRRGSPQKPLIGLLERGLMVLKCVTFEPEPHLRDITTSTALDKATVLRILDVVTAGDDVQRLDDGRHALARQPYTSLPSTARLPTSTRA